LTGLPPAGPIRVRNHDRRIMSRQSVPTTHFHSGRFSAAEQFDAWKERISVIFNVERLDTDASDGFAAQALAFHLAELILARTRFDGQRFVRTSRQARSDMIDHYLIQFYRDGGYVGEVDGARLEIRAGDVSILDLSR